jgi:tripeptide aminopeptidase
MTYQFTVTERFIKYARVNTQSDITSGTSPSSAGQTDLARIILDDLVEAGCTEISLDPNGYLMATLPASVPGKHPVVGFIAHMDTSPDFTAVDVNPRIIKDYGGEDIPLDTEGAIRLKPGDFPELLDYRGQDLIVTDGSTLLGADDKSGIAAIVEAMGWLHRHPEVPHGKIRVGFTPDEEIGRGADLFDVKKFGADFAYTVDGGPIGEIEYENFNAAAAIVSLQGRNVHPGTAKDKMVNALQLAVDLHSQLPAGDRPEKTEGYEGFFHLTRLEGTVESARMEYIIRDHDSVKFRWRKELLAGIGSELRAKYPSARVKVMIKDQYFNMREMILPVYPIVELAASAIREAGLEPKIVPIRGGTDGSKLSFMGLPTPNLFTGGHNFHGRFEFIPVRSLQKATEVIIHLARLAVQTDLNKKGK